ncbi:molybdopterin-dependent oxidoreductase [Marinospirillum perlucidum]|uniref:molybdopterin-dependent oxidoreductase n=1 Tax=Marinospirillum perlucidum TaxID=1982602 RepID=UPI000DF46175|nr:molybdopterin-dependent oxidoreductase [Marinospirillum perlucidum]
MHQRFTLWWQPAFFLLVGFLLLGHLSAAWAEAPQALVLTKGGERQSLSLSEIESLGLYEVTMQHPEGPEGTFAGVWLDDFLASQGLDEAGRVRFIAEDGYTTFLTAEDRQEKSYLLVTRLDGEPVPQEDLGPFMLIVPEDAEAALDGSASITRWIWALRQIQVQ